MMACGASTDGCGGSCGCDEGMVCENGACGEPGPGDTCEDPYIVDADSLPFDYAGDTSVALNDYASGSCPGALGSLGGASADHVFRFTPTQAGIYTVKLNASFDSALYAATDCADNANTCLGAHDTLGEEILTLDLAADVPISIFVDGWSNSSDLKGTYNLSISDACVGECVAGSCGVDNGCGLPCTCAEEASCFEQTCCLPTCQEGVCDNDDGCGGTCGCSDALVCNAGVCGDPPMGDVCTNPYSVEFDANGTFVHAGDSNTANNDYGYSTGACPGVGSGWGKGAKDEAFRLVATVAGTYTVSLDATFDSNLYAVTDCTDVDATCLAADETFGGESFVLDLAVDESVYVIVDGYGNSSNQSGPYSLTIQAPTP